MSFGKNTAHICKIVDLFFHLNERRALRKHISGRYWKYDALRFYAPARFLRKQGGDHKKSAVLSQRCQ